MAMPSVQVLMTLGGLLAGQPPEPVAKTFMGSATQLANVVGTFNIGAEADDRYVIVGFSVTGQAANFGGVNINGLAATGLADAGIQQNASAKIYYRRVPAGATCTVQVVGVRSEIYVWRVTGIPLDGPVSTFASAAGYIFPGGPAQPVHAQTPTLSFPENSVTFAVCFLNPNPVAAQVWGGILKDADNSGFSSGASRIDAVTVPGAITYDCQTQGSCLFVVGNMAGPEIP